MFDTLADAQRAVESLAQQTKDHAASQNYRKLGECLKAAEARILALELVVRALAKKTSLTDPEVAGERTTSVFADQRVKSLVRH